MASVDINNIIEKVKIAVQINGKTRDVISVKKDLSQKEVESSILKKSKQKNMLIIKRL